MRPCVLGIDVGTTCTKALLVDEAGAVIGQGSFGYGLISSGSCIEQRAEDWEQAVLTAARQAVEAAGDAEAAAVSFSTQGGSTVAVDRDGKFLGNSWTWMDTRSAPEADEVEAAAAMGLRAGIPVYNGAHDQYCAAIGAGAVHDGDMLLSAGTTWVLMGITRKPLFTDSYVAPGKHPVEGLYGAIASLVSSGASLQWFKNNFLPEEFDEMNRVVDTRREKARDLFFYPYMAGANFPLHCPNARGAFTGINLEHDRFDFARAIMEGVAFGVCRAAEDFRRNGSDIRTITMMGGAAKSSVWMQMIASAAGIPILRLNQADVCALGAAYIAACGAGWFGSYADAARAMVHPEKLYEPIPEESAWYKEKFRRCARMWDHMQAYYEGLEE